MNSNFTVTNTGGGGFLGGSPSADFSTRDQLFLGGGASGGLTGQPSSASSGQPGAATSTQTGIVQGGRGQWAVYYTVPKVL